MAYGTGAGSGIPQSLSCPIKLKNKIPVAKRHGAQRNGLPDAGDINVFHAATGQRRVYNRRTSY